MANPIKHTDLFDFPAYEAAIKSVRTESVAFAKDMESVIKRLTTDQKQLSAALKDYAEMMRKFNVTQTGATAKLEAYNKQLFDNITRITEAKAAITGLDLLLTTQKTTVNSLVSSYRDMGKEVKNLKDKSQDFVKSQTDIKDKIAAATAAVNGQTGAMQKLRNAILPAEGTLDRMRKDLVNLRKEFGSMPNAVNQFTGALNKSNPAAVELQKRIQGLDKSVKEAEKGLGQFYRNVGNYSSAFSKFGGAISSLALQYLTLNTAVMLFGKAVDVSTRFESLNTAIKVISDTSTDFANTQQFLAQTAEKYGQDIFVLTESYKGLLAATKGTNLEGAETRKIFTSVVGAGTALKLSNEQVQGTLLALQQMISKGNVQAEELRGQLGERLPGAFRLFADAIGVSETQLNKMLQKGEVLAEETLPKFAAKLEEVYGQKAIDGASALVNETNRLNNAFNNFLSSDKITSFLAGLKKGLSTFINDVSFFIDEKNPNKDFLDFFSNNGVKGKNKVTERREAQEEREAAKLEALYKFEVQTVQEREKGIQAAAAETVRIQKLVDAGMANLRAQKNKDVKNDLGKQIALQQQSLDSQKEYLNAIVELDAKQREKEGKPKNATDTELSKAEISAFNKAENEKLALLKNALDTELKLNELKYLQNLQREETFQRAKLDIITRYAAAATLASTSSDKDQDFANQVLDARIALQKYINDNKKATQISLIDTGANLPDYKQSSKDLLASQKAGAKKIGSDYDTLIGGEKDAFSVLNAGGDATFKQQKDYLDRLAKLNQEAADKIGMKDVELSKKYADEAGQARVASRELTAKLEAQIEQQKNDLIKEIATMAVTAIQDQFNAGFEKRIKGLETEKDKALAAAGTNATAREAIEKRYNERIAKEKKKQAIADKTAAIFGIAINTAAAIIKNNAQLGFVPAQPINIMTFIQGALQAAIIAAKPIPAFKKGKKRFDGYSGPAVINEEGFEIIEDSKGRMRVAPGGITMLKKDEKVYTHAESKRLARESLKREEINRILQLGLLQSGTARDINNGRAAYETRAMNANGVSGTEMRSIMTEAVRSMPQTIFDLNERGLRKWIKSKNELREILNGR